MFSSLILSLSYFPVQAFTSQMLLWILFVGGRIISPKRYPHTNSWYLWICDKRDLYMTKGCGWIQDLCIKKKNKTLIYKDYLVLAGLTTCNDKCVLSRKRNQRVRDLNMLCFWLWRWRKGPQAKKCKWPLRTGKVKEKDSL